MATDGEHIAYNSRYWTAQVCLAGHVQNGGIEVLPSEKYCECGAETIHQCPFCQSNIKGAYRYGGRMKQAPLGCLKCGKKYPWTQSVIDEMSQLIAESELDSLEKEETKADLEVIISNAPGAEIAAHRTHRRFAKMGNALRVAYNEGVVPIIADTLVKIMKGS
jgi:hypothetical protein